MPQLIQNHNGQMINVEAAEAIRWENTDTGDKYGVVSIGKANHLIVDDMQITKLKAFLKAQDQA